MRLAEQRFPLPDAEKFGEEVSWRSLPEYIESHALLLTRLNGFSFDVLKKCSPADGTNAAVEIDRGSARPSAAI